MQMGNRKLCDILALHGRQNEMEKGWRRKRYIKQMGKMQDNN